METHIGQAHRDTHTAHMHTHAPMYTNTYSHTQTQTWRRAHDQGHGQICSTQTHTHAAAVFAMKRKTPSTGPTGQQEGSDLTARAAPSAGPPSRPWVSVSHVILTHSAGANSSEQRNWRQRARPRSGGDEAGMGRRVFRKGLERRQPEDASKPG